MDLQTITTVEELESSLPEWDTLWREHPAATPFQSPYWLLPWWRNFGCGELFVITVRTNNRLTALAPLHILRDEESDESLGLLLGTGISDYLDPLITSRGEAGEIAVLLTGADCALWDLQQLRPDSPMVDVPVRTGWDSTIEENDPCVLLRIDEAGNDLENLISIHFRKKLRYYRRLAAREGELRYEEATRDNLDELLTGLFTLHAARWSTRGLPGVLADDVIQTFHRQAASLLLDAGALRTYGMRIGGRLVAVFYGFAQGDTWYYYLSGYDPSIEKLGPGTLLVAYAIEEAVRAGAGTFDFLRGSEEYKYAWGATDRVNKRRQIVRQ